MTGSLTASETACWPNLSALRWSVEQASGFYASGIWDPRGFDALLAAHASSAPGKLAYHDGHDRITYGELHQRARGVAAGLRDRGIEPGAVVGVRMGNSIEHIVVAHAVAAAGVVLFELPPDAGAAQVAASLRRTSATALISSIPVAPEEAAALSGPALVLETTDELAASGAVDLPEQDPDAVALLIGTSGTTGTPKIVMRTANGSLAMSRNVVSRSGVGPEDILMVAAPLSGGVGYINALCTAAVTGCSVILPGSLGAAELLALVESERVTSIATLPTIAVRMAAVDGLDRFDTTSLRTIQTGGAYLHERMAETLEERFACRVAIVYGAIDVGTPTMVSPGGDAAERRRTTVGRGVFGAEFGVMDGDGELLAVGEVGEVVMRGPNTAIGYYADAAATRLLFDSAGWGHFGDLGRIDDHGYLQIVGRLKEIINRGGKKISVNEVENHVRAFPGVTDVAAVGYEDPDLGERCAVFVVTDGGVRLTLDALREFLTGREVAKYLWPERIEHLDELPVSAQGKVRRRELRDRLAKGSVC